MLIFAAFMGANTLNYFGVTALFQPAHCSAAFDSGYVIALVPFGVHCVLIGYLIFRSIFLPRVLGVLMVLAGAGYLIFIWPPVGNRLFFPWIVVPPVLGEGPLRLLLLIVSVNVDRWKRQDGVVHADDAPQG